MQFKNEEDIYKLKKSDLIFKTYLNIVFSPNIEESINVSVDLKNQIINVILIKLKLHFAPFPYTHPDVPLFGKSPSLQLRKSKKTAYQFLIQVLYSCEL